MYQKNGWAGTANLEAAAAILRDLVARGRKSACRWYGDMLLRGNMPGSDLYYGMELIKEACEWGDPFAMVDVGEYVRESCRRVVVKWG